MNRNIQWDDANRQKPWKFSIPAISAQIHPNKLLRAISKIILFQSQTFGKSNFKNIMVIKRSGFRQQRRPGWTVVLQNQTTGLENHLLFPPPSFRKKEKELCQDRVWTNQRSVLGKLKGSSPSLKSSLLVGLLSGSCLKVLKSLKGQKSSKPWNNGSSLYNTSCVPSTILGNF